MSLDQRKNLQGKLLDERPSHLLRALKLAMAKNNEKRPELMKRFQDADPVGGHYPPTPVFYPDAKLLDWRIYQDDKTLSVETG